MAMHEGNSGLDWLEKIYYSFEASACFQQFQKKEVFHEYLENNKNKKTSCKGKKWMHDIFGSTLTKKEYTGKRVVYGEVNDIYKIILYNIWYYI